MLIFCYFTGGISHLSLIIILNKISFFTHLEAAKQRSCLLCSQQLAPRALYFYNAFHDLKLKLSKACNISDMQCMLDVMKIVGVLFEYFQQKKEKYYYRMCWIELHWKISLKQYIWESFFGTQYEYNDIPQILIFVHCSES